MSIELEHERDNVYRLPVRGTLQRVDFQRVQDSLTSEIQRRGAVRLLFILDGFEGWNPNDQWSDLTFFVKYGDRIERIAIVGPERWRGESLMFAGADLRKAPVEFFADGDVDAARAWLTD
jgi:SpoIIAA-like